MVKSPKTLVWYWGPAVLWLAFVAFASTGIFSAEHTGSILFQILKALHVPWNYWDRIHFLTRKTAHVTEYGILAALIFRGFRGTTLPQITRAWHWRWALAAWMACVAMAIADEVHQSFDPSRTGTWKDVVLDAAGAACAQLVVWAFLHTRERRKARMARPQARVSA